MLSLDLPDKITQSERGSCPRIGGCPESIPYLSTFLFFPKDDEIPAVGDVTRHGWWWVTVVITERALLPQVYNR